MEDQRQSSLHRHHSWEAEGGPRRGQDNGVLGTGAQDTVSGSRRATDAGKLRFEDQEEEALPEEATGGEVPSPLKHDVVLRQLDGGPEKDTDEGVSEIRWVCPAGAGAVGGEQRSQQGPGGVCGPVCPCEGLGCPECELALTLTLRQKWANTAPSRAWGSGLETFQRH